MRQIPYRIVRAQSAFHGMVGAASVDSTDDLGETIVESVIGDLGTEIEIKLGDTTVFLAMLQDFEHWAEDWAERGIDDPEAFLAALVEQEDQP